MPDLTSLNEFTATAGSALALLGVVVTWVKVLRPRWRKAHQEVVAVKTALIGRDEIRDPVTNELLSPAQEGIGVRQARTESQMEILTDAVAKIADSHLRLENHEGRLKALEDAAVERVVSKVESAQMFQAMESAIKATPPPAIDE